MPIPKIARIKVAVAPWQFMAIANLTNAVRVAINAHPTCLPSPNPSLATLLAAELDLYTKISELGPCPQSWITFPVACLNCICCFMQRIVIPRIRLRAEPSQISLNPTQHNLPSSFLQASAFVILQLLKAFSTLLRIYTVK